jgi:putative transposase
MKRAMHALPIGPHTVHYRLHPWLLKGNHFVVVRYQTPKELPFSNHGQRTMYAKPQSGYPINNKNKTLIMSTYTQVFYQIVFGTKYRLPTINRKHDRELYKFIYGVIQKRGCHLYCINGVEDHIHIFSDLHSSISLADYVKEIKVASNTFMKDSGLFPLFDGWQVGYGAFTYSIRKKQKIINYVEKQKERHGKETFYDEYERLLIESSVEFDEKYLL